MTPVRADRHERQRQRIVAGQNRKFRAGRRAQLRHAVATAARFLDADDVFAIARQPFHRFDADLDAAAPGNAVKHDGQFRRLGDGAKMLIQPFLRRLVVIRRDLQRTVRAGFFGGLRQINRLARRIAARAGEHFDFARGKFHRQLDDA